MNEVKYAIAILKEKLANADQHNLAYQRLSIADMEAIWGALEKSDKSYAELKGQRDALAVEELLKGWVPCTPQWIERNGQCSCETAPRIAFGDIGPHYHPDSFARANGKIEWVPDPLLDPEVVPDEMTSKQASGSYGGEVAGYRDGFNACRAAIMRNIEEAK